MELTTLARTRLLPTTLSHAGVTAYFDGDQQRADDFVAALESRHLSFPFDAKTTLESKSGTHTVARLGALTDAGIGHVDKVAKLVALLRTQRLRRVRRHDALEVGDERLELAGHLALGEDEGARRQLSRRVRRIGVLLRALLDAPSGLASR